MVIGAILLPIVACFVPTFLGPGALLVGLLLWGLPRIHADRNATPLPIASGRFELTLLVGSAVLLLKDLAPAPATLRASWAWLDTLPGGDALGNGLNPAPLTSVHAVVLLATVLIGVRLCQQLFTQTDYAETWLATTAVLGGAAALPLCLSPPDLTPGALRWGTLTNVNGIAGALALSCLAAAGWAWIAFRRRHTGAMVTAVLATLLAGSACLQLASRGATAALVTGVAVGVGVSLRSQFRFGRRFTLLYLAVVALGALLLAPAVVAEQLDVGVGSRAEIWRSALHIWAQTPWRGLGLGLFEPQFALLGGLLPSLGAQFVHPDSSWVLLLFEFGLLGLAVLAICLAALARDRHRHLREDGQVLRAIAWAGTTAWVVPAIGDVSLHRPALLVLGVPMVGLLLRGRSASAPARPRAWPVFATGTVALAALFFSLRPYLGRAEESEQGVNAYAKDPNGQVSLTETGRASLRIHPLDAVSHHQLGRAALLQGDLKLASRHWHFAAQLQPANYAMLRQYAVALQARSPELALPHWQLALAGAPEIRAGELSRLLTEYPELNYDVAWQAAGEDPAMLIVLAGAFPTTAGQQAFTDWLQQPAAALTTPLRLSDVVAGFARWGSRRDFARWLATRSQEPRAVGDAAQRFVRVGRADLAWVLLEQLLPEPSALPASAVTARSVARLDPADKVSLGHRIAALDPSSDNYLQLLQDAVQAQDIAPWFLLRHAHAEARSGDFAAASQSALRALAAQR